MREGQPSSRRVGGGKKSAIRYLSHKSRTRLMFIVTTTKIEFRSMITLTVGETVTTDGKDFKRALNRYLVNYRRKFGGEYVWFLEFQRRGAPHIHMFSQVDSPTDKERGINASIWGDALALTNAVEERIGEWGAGSWAVERGQIEFVNSRERHWENFRSPQGAMRYAAKYTLKTTQKQVPERYSNVGRFWGCSSGVKPAQAHTVHVGLDEKWVRGYLARHGRTFDGVDYLPKYVFGVGECKE